MLVRIFETPVIDTLLILLAIRFIWPGVFGIRSRNRNGANHRRENVVNVPRQENHSKTSDDQGEYIDYEEIK